MTRHLTPERALIMLVAAGCVPLILLLSMLLRLGDGLDPERTRVTVLTEQVPRLGWLRYELNLCANHHPPLAVRASREIEMVPLEGSGIVSLPPIAEFTVQSPCEHREFLVQLPPVDSGFYVIRVHTTVELSPLNRSEQTWSSAAFYVSDQK